MAGYELTQCNSILFKKQRIEDLEIGADEPSVAIIFKKKKKGMDSTIEYITPSLNSLSKFLKIIIVKTNEIEEVPQQELLEDDRLWRILAVGDMEDYRLIKKLETQKSSTLSGLYGFSPTLSENYKTILKNVEYTDKDCISPLIFLKNQIKRTPKSGMKITRERSGCNSEMKEYEKEKLFIKRYIESDLRVRAVYDDVGYMFKDNLLGVLFDYDYRLMLSFFNSSLISYFLYFSSAQIGKGTWNMLHKNEIESVPIPSEANVPLAERNKLKKLIDRILVAGITDQKTAEEIDEIVFNIYHLKEFEKQRVRDFFNVCYRSGTNAFVTPEDLQRYADRFRTVFSFILKADRYLNAKGYTSNFMGTGILFVLGDIKDKKEEVELLNLHDIKEFIAVSKIQLDSSQKNGILRQDKVKLYNQAGVVIIKSNQFKDWSETEAIKDANEEIELFLKHLSEQ